MVFPPYLVFLTVNVVHHSAKNVRASGAPPWLPALEPGGDLRWPPQPTLLWRLLTRPRFSATEAFARLDPCLFEQSAFKRIQVCAGCNWWLRVVVIY